MIYQAITTRFIAPTNTRGQRVKAIAAAGTVITYWDHSMNPNDNHAAAAKALASKYEWRGAWYGGGMPDGKGNVYVCVDIEAAPDFISDGK